MLYHSNESYAINGAAMQVYNVLGHGFLECNPCSVNYAP
jgi:hypothetical protein